MQGKGVAAPYSRQSVNMANLARLSVLVADADADRNRDAAELVMELGVRNVVRVHSLPELREALRTRAFDVLLCGERLAHEDGATVLQAAKKLAPATRGVLLRPSDRAGEPVPEDVEAIEVPFGRLTLQGVLHRAASPRGGLWCEVPELSLTDILQMYHQVKRSVTVLLSGPIAGRIWLDAGEIVDAESGDHRGLAALSRLLEAETGLLRTEPPPGQVPRTIDGPFQSALLEAAQQLDERRRDDKRPEPEPASVSAEVLGSGGPPVLTADIPDVGSFAAPAGKRRRRRLAASGLLAILLAVGGAAIYLSERPQGGRQPREAAPAALQQATRALTPAPPAPAAPARGEGPEPPAPERTAEAARPERARDGFQLTIRSRPSRATVIEDGKLLGKTPLTLTIGASSVAARPREFVLRLRGHLPARLTQGPSAVDMSAEAVLSPRQPVVEVPDAGQPEAASGRDTRGRGRRRDRTRLRR